MCTKTEIAEYWCSVAGHARWPGAMVDLGEPACMGCNWFCVSWDKAKKPWEAAKGLERAHIVAASIGGSSAPSNFVVLCQLCHEEAPMTSDAALMFRWLDAREDNAMRQSRMVLQELSRLGIKAEDLLHIHLVDLVGMLTEAAKALGVTPHWSRLGRGSIVTASTRAAMLAHAIRASASQGRVEV